MKFKLSKDSIDSICLTAVVIALLVLVFKGCELDSKSNASGTSITVTNSFNTLK